jgi:uncharacterized membrane protein YphA (DoxX/SURF4 family)
MEIIQNIVQILLPLGIFNVWFVRSKQGTAYRGGNSANLKEEFAAYGLPGGAFYVIGTLKVGSAILLLLGFFLPVLVFPAALLMASLMSGAVLMHAKVRDPAIRYLPAGLMLAMSLVLLV